ncbi:MAG: recombinase family protein [Methylocella sp.]
MILGNARVSTYGQSLDAQVKQVRAAGAAKVFKETASGAKTDRVRVQARDVFC